MARAHVGGQFYGVPNILLEQLFNVRAPQYSVALLFINNPKTCICHLAFLLAGHYVILLSVKAYVCMQMPQI